MSLETISQGNHRNSTHMVRQVRHEQNQRAGFFDLAEEINEATIIFLSTRSKEQSPRQDN